ncbi:MAG: hypothetical protein IJN19_06165 [Opitutales bacterium]|nr:hypothetical protein [Opitutales bacterium]
MNNETASELEKEPAGTPPAENTELTSVPPKKKCRWIKRILIALGVLIVAVLAVVAFFLGPIVKFGVNTFGASFLGVDQCSIQSAKIYPLTGHVRFEKILVGKPIIENGAFSHDVFSVDLVDVDVDMLSLFAQKKVLDRLEILNPSANYEQLFSGVTNVDVILKNVMGEPKPENEVAAGTPSQSEEAPSTSEKPAEEIFIGARYFVIKNVRVAAYLRGMPVVFPPMSTDFSQGIGMDENLTPLAFGTKVAGNFMSVIDFFRKSVLGDMANAAMGAVSDAAVMTGDAAKAAAVMTGDAAKAAADATMTAVSDAATLTGDAAKATTDAALGAVSDAATLTGDAAKATADAVTDAADAVFNIFKSDKKEDKK